MARNSRYGLARLFAAPTHAMSVASCRPWLNATTSDSAVTGPPNVTPAAHDGRSTCGNVKSTCPGRRSPNNTWRRTRTTMIAHPKRTKLPNVRAHGACGRRAATTIHATPTSNPNSSGFVVRNAAVASASAQIHHASGCSERGLTKRAGDGAAPRPRPPHRARSATPRRRSRPPARRRTSRAPGGAAIPPEVSATTTRSNPTAASATVVEDRPRVRSLRWAGAPWPSSVDADGRGDGTGRGYGARRLQARSTGVVAAGVDGGVVAPGCGAVVPETAGRVVVGVVCGMQIAAAIAGPRGGGSVGSPVPSVANASPRPCPGRRAATPGRSSSTTTCRRCRESTTSTRSARSCARRIPIAGARRSRTTTPPRCTAAAVCPSSDGTRREERRAVVARARGHAHRAHRRPAPGVDDDRDVHVPGRAGASHRAAAQRRRQRERDERGCLRARAIDGS